jgi:hypothetical protein
MNSLVNKKHTQVKNLLWSQAEERLWAQLADQLESPPWDQLRKGIEAKLECVLLSQLIQLKKQLEA